jgi:hypothetical protein
MGERILSWSTTFCRSMPSLVDTVSTPRVTPFPRRDSCATCAKNRDLAVPGADSHVPGRATMKHAPQMILQRLRGTMSAARTLLKVDLMNASRSPNRFAVPLLASFALASLVGCGGNLTSNGAGGSSGSESPNVAGNVSASTGGSNSSGTGTVPATGCTPHDCEGLAVTDDAKLCPDGTGLGRTVCAMRANGTCGWDFPDCPSGPGVADASTGPTRPRNGPCPPVTPRNLGMLPGPCSLVGRWFLNSSHGIVHIVGVIEFDADGSYYGGPIGTDLSQTYSYNGAYSYNASGPASTVFHLLGSCGDGCSGEGYFSLTFQNGCASANLHESETRCTGDRIVVAGDVMLTRQ